MTNPSKKEIQVRDVMDRRYFPRWAVENRVIYTVESSKTPQEAKTKDLSGAGACLWVKEPLELNQKMKLIIYLSENVTVRLNAQVTWAKQCGNQNYAGVSFYNTSLQAQDLILEHAFDLDREQFVQHFFKGWDVKK